MKAIVFETIGGSKGNKMIGRNDRHFVLGRGQKSTWYKTKITLICAINNYNFFEFRPINIS
jgi:hypothetical protein